MTETTRTEPWDADTEARELSDMMGYQAKELPKALVAAQKEFKTVKKDSVNPFYESKYLSLAGLIEAVLPIANKHGIAVLQDVGWKEGGVTVTTVLIHESGETIQFGPMYIPSKDDPQSYGKAASYGRRYHLSGVFCIAAEDDDAEGAMDRETTKTPVSKPTAKEPQTTGVTVLSITPKTGKFPYIINTNEGEYRTYDDRVAAHAEIARATNATFQFQWTDSKYGRQIFVDPKIFGAPQTS
jgi:hypothetical protein